MRDIGRARTPTGTAVDAICDSIFLAAKHLDESVPHLTGYMPAWSESVVMSTLHSQRHAHTSRSDCSERRDNGLSVSDIMSCGAFAVVGVMEVSI